DAAQLDAEYWVRRLAKPSKLVMAPAGIAAQNKLLQQRDPSLNDIWSLPASLPAGTVRAWITSLSQLPTKPLWDQQGVAVDKTALDTIADSVALDAVPDSQPARYGLVVARANLRSFPTRLRVFNSHDNTDIDRFQESALFPGTPVVLAHESRDRQWWFVVSPLYAAWIEKTFVAEGSRDEVFAYANRTPTLVVTGPTVQTVFTPEQPGVSQLKLDMGVRVPLLTDWPAGRPVNGQNPYSAQVIQLPIRAADGSLQLVPALVPRNADVAPDYLPMSKANILRQSFKFLGERYGWGHDYDGRDCSGFVSEVYRSLGVQLPRNSHAQGVSPALNRIEFTEASDHVSRFAAIRKLQVGDLIYIPGHVMMVIGYDHGMPYVIHDTTGASYRDSKGEITHVVLNAVSVTPLTPLLFNQTQSYIDRMYSIQRIRPVTRSPKANK
ncbi:MAG: SH3 domain-containing protein, partial [Arenimonas sp.]